MIKNILIVSAAVLIHISFTGALFSDEIKKYSIEQLQKAGFTSENMSKDAFLKLRNKVFEIPDYESGQFSIDKMKKIDAKGNKLKGYIATINGNCTSDPAEVFILASSDGNEYIVQRFDSLHASLDEILRDIDGDGNFEILVNEEIAGENTPRCNSFFWVNIYTWKEGGGFVIDNEKFIKSYYFKEYLNMISKRIAEAEHLLNMPEKDPDASKVKTIALSMLEDCRTALSKLSKLAEKK
ncbi:MAG TPA: hypothetical protein DCZ94_05195 [Lentisphaeria bacterium]|nr:MAG: hypothetical protein A2X48_00060 [Lentisphaerae bacterium GWF2_49_21]HBC86334.1 hypothetical protein [Lentisphaeria bacterium]